MFLNETMHPEAAKLLDIILSSEDTYAALCRWQRGRRWSDEMTGDLYAYIEDAFEAKPIASISHANAVSMISACLWATSSVNNQ